MLRPQVYANFFAWQKESDKVGTNASHQHTMWTYVHALNPVLFSFGPLTVRWYGLAYVFGFLFAWWYYRQVLAKKTDFPLEEKQIPDLILFALIGLLIGARTVYMLVYNLDAFLAAPQSFFFVWEGGLSFHGALIGVIIAIALYLRMHKKPIAFMADRLILPVPLALFFGRITNFINGELIGRPFTDGSFPICIQYPPESICRYPSQLLQGLTEGLLLFVILQILFWCTPLSRKPGAVFGSFLALYGLFRFFTEYLRAPDPQLGLIGNTLSMGQLLCLPMILFGIGCVVYAFLKNSSPTSSHAA